MTLHVCIPALNERDFLPETLECLAEQDISDFTVSVCVNQPDAWHNLSDKTPVCLNNAETLDFLRRYKKIRVNIIDRSSKGKGWPSQDGGVGAARKTVMDTVMRQASPEDLLVSLDSDTRICPGYLRSIRENFQRHPDAVALSVPYYHRLTGEERADRAILRYEIYMRNYAINLWRIGCPYRFTALGSAIALRASSYKAIGGMTPKKSGEDFYFLQKLRKYGRVLTYNEEKAYPAARFSDRVFFGTGPAMIKGDLGDWESYPVYHYRLFDQVHQTYQAFPELFHRDIETPMSAFLREVFNTSDLWGPIRNNFREPAKFLRACHEKVDALRILQFLKASQKNIPENDEDCLKEFLQKFYPEAVDMLSSEFSFPAATVDELNSIRNFLADQEEIIQKNEHR